MATFTGTDADEIITPDIISDTVVATGTTKPSGNDDTISAGNGDDTVAGGGGKDIVNLGAGDDLFLWAPGHGEDTVEGGFGHDTVEYTGVSGTDTIEIFRDGDIVRITDVSPPVSLTGVEVVKLFATGGGDAIFVHDLAGTAVEEVVVDLGLSAGGPGDGLEDRVGVVGTDADDALVVTASAGEVTVAGMAARLSVTGTDGATDSLRLDGRLGDDRIDASAMAKNVISIGMDGGDGRDTLIGGDGDDWFYGGDGKDVIRGGSGKDSLDGGEGADLLKGGKGADTFHFSTDVIGSGRDRIDDFNIHVDTIIIEAGSSPLGDNLEKSEFRFGTKAKDGNDFILYDRDSGIVRWDADGKGGVKAVAFAKIDAGINLTHKDFDLLLE